MTTKTNSSFDTKHPGAISGARSLSNNMFLAFSLIDVSLNLRFQFCGGRGSGGVVQSKRARTRSTSSPDSLLE